MEISIDQQLKQIAPSLTLGIISGKGVISKHNNELWRRIDDEVRNVQSTLTLQDLHELREVAALREAYRNLGKDPSRYRGSQESLLRRLLQRKPLYQINTLVDINNYISICSKYSCGCYDLSGILPPVRFRIGESNESYRGIGKDIINLEGLPIFADLNGPFGSPTSDSEGNDHYRYLEVHAGNHCILGTGSASGSS